MSQHSFFAAWNFHQYLVCKNNLEKGLILVVHDYAQNYLCIHQNEIQAMHWSHAQVMMHPSCISYRCPIEGCSHVVLHEIVHISADMTHNAHLVKRFQSANLEILRRHGVEIHKIIEFTDQAPSQYKNKSVFRYLAQEKIPTIRNYFGVHHGKGPCDACAGRIKGRLATLVKSEECIINSPATCFEACKKLETEWPNKNECCHYILNFNYTGKIAKQPDTSKWKGVQSTREHMHSIMNTRKNLTVNVRDVVCLCTGCLLGDSACRYSDYVDEWRGFDMLKFKDTNVNMSLWNSVNICKKIGSHEEFKWEDVRAILQSFSDYDEALAYVKKNPLPFLDCHIDIKLSEHDRKNIDPVALHYVPADASRGLTPCKIAGDGNCFPRTFSYICFRSQENDAEFCVRLEYEALLNGKHYLSNCYLSRGCKIVYRKVAHANRLLCTRKHTIQMKN